MKINEILTKKDLENIREYVEVITKMYFEDELDINTESDTLTPKQLEAYELVYSKEYLETIQEAVAMKQESGKLWW